MWKTWNRSQIAVLRRSRLRSVPNVRSAGGTACILRKRFRRGHGLLHRPQDVEAFSDQGVYGARSVVFACLHASGALDPVKHDFLGREASQPEADVVNELRVRPPGRRGRFHPSSADAGADVRGDGAGGILGGLSEVARSSLTSLDPEGDDVKVSSSRRRTMSHDFHQIAYVVAPTSPVD